MEQTQPKRSHEKNDTTPEVTQDHSDDGVDLTLIRWMLSLSPEERLQALQSTIRSVVSLQNAKPHT